MKPCGHDSHDLYARLIGPIREAARGLGYAVAVHGSLVRDIDLIACPWSEDAAPARVLAEAVRDAARGVNGKADMAWKPEVGPEYSLEGRPGGKPHGRLCWCFHLGGGPYIDLSVMPRTDAS